MTVMVSRREFGRPIVVTPRTPPDRIRALRESLAKILKEAELLAAVKKARLEMDYTRRLISGLTMSFCPGL